MTNRKRHHKMAAILDCQLVGVASGRHLVTSPLLCERDRKRNDVTCCFKTPRLPYYKCGLSNKAILVEVSKPS